MRIRDPKRGQKIPSNPYSEKSLELARSIGAKAAANLRAAGRQVDWNPADGSYTVHPRSEDPEPRN